MPFYRPSLNTLRDFGGPVAYKMDQNLTIENGSIVAVSNTGANQGYAVVPSNGLLNAYVVGVCVDGGQTNGATRGATSVTCSPGYFPFANSGSNPCSQATVGAKVYAADGGTISTASGDGPLAGTLRAYNPDDPHGLPCYVEITGAPRA